MLENTYSNWDLLTHLNHPSINGTYVSTSSRYEAADAFGGSNDGVVYAAFVEGGLDVSATKLFNYRSEYEISVPGGVSWQNIVGIKVKNYDVHSSYHPVFLKKGFSTQDKENFWEILNTMGGKTQCKYQLGENIKKANACLEYFEKGFASDPMQRCAESISRFQMLGREIDQNQAKEICKNHVEYYGDNFIYNFNVPSICQQFFGFGINW